MDGAIAFISLCTRAQKNKKSLIDARYHFFIRSLEGCYITLNGDKRLFLNRQRTYWENGKESAVFKRPFVMIAEELHWSAKLKVVDWFRQASSRKKSNITISMPMIMPILKMMTLRTKPTERKKCSISARSAEQSLPKMRFIICLAIAARKTISKVIKAKILKIGARCGNCHTGHYKRLYLGNDAATAVLATSLYEELPEIEYVESEDQTKAKNIFARAATANKKVARKTGRQFLAFSDSRQEAAKFACYLGKRAITNSCVGVASVASLRKEKTKSYPMNIRYPILLPCLLITSQQRKAFAKSNSDESNLTLDSRKNAWVALLNELARYNSTTSLTALGQIQFSIKVIRRKLLKALRSCIMPILFR